MSGTSSDDRLAELEREVRWLRSRVEPLMNARFLDAATETTDVLRLRLIGYDDGESVVGVPDGVVWEPRVDDDGDPVYPQEGDSAWALEADDGRWVVVQWQPS